MLIYLNKQHILQCYLYNYRRWKHGYTNFNKRRLTQLPCWAINHRSYESDWCRDIILTHSCSISTHWQRKVGESYQSLVVTSIILSSDNFLYYKQFVCSLNTIFVFLGPKLPAQHIVHGFGLTGCHWQERTSVTGNLHVGSIFDFHFSLQIVAHNLVECPWWVTTPNVLVVVGIHVNILVSSRLWTNK